MNYFKLNHAKTRTIFQSNKNFLLQIDTTYNFTEIYELRFTIYNASGINDLITLFKFFFRLLRRFNIDFSIHFWALL